MNEDLARAISTSINVLEFLGLLVGAIWAYRKFNRELADKQKELREALKVRRDSLLAAFNAEVEQISEFLGSECAAYLKLLPDNLPVVTKLFTPADVYKANVGSIGDLGDAVLVSSLVSLYAKLFSLGERVGSFDKGIYSGTEATCSYLLQLSICLRYSVHLSAFLRGEAEHIKSIEAGRFWFTKSESRNLERAEELIRAAHSMKELSCNPAPQPDA